MFIMELNGSEEELNVLQYDQNSSATSYLNEKCLAVLSITKKYMSTADSLHIQIALDEKFTQIEAETLAADIAQLILLNQADS